MAHLFITTLWLDSSTGECRKLFLLKLKIFFSNEKLIFLLFILKLCPWLPRCLCQGFIPLRLDQKPRWNVIGQFPTFLVNIFEIPLYTNKVNSVFSFAIWWCYYFCWTFSYRHANITESFMTFRLKVSEKYT